MFKNNKIKKEKIPLIIGFLGRKLHKNSKVKLYKEHK